MFYTFVVCSSIVEVEVVVVIYFAPSEQIIRAFWTPLIKCPILCALV